MSTLRQAHRTAYDDLASPQEMRADCQAADGTLDLPRISRAAQRPAPSIRFEDVPRRDGIDMLVAAEHLARKLDLDLD